MIPPEKKGMRWLAVLLALGGCGAAGGPKLQGNWLREDGKQFVQYSADGKYSENMTDPVASMEVAWRTIDESSGAYEIYNPQAADGKGVQCPGGDPAEWGKIHLRFIDVNTHLRRCWSGTTETKFLRQ